jgi:hypothetical protein
MVFQSLVYGMEQTCRLKNTKCIKSTWLQKSQSIYDYPDHVSILTYDWSHHPATRSCLYTVILQEKSSSSYPDNVSMLTYDRRSHHPAIRIISLYYHMTGEVIIQLPGSCFYTDIWLEKSSSSYPDNVSMQSYDRRSCNPATRILSLYCHMTGEAIIRILSLYCHMTWEVITQLVSYPDNVSILSYDWRSHHPATRILALYWHLTGEVITQLVSYPDNVSILSYDWRSHHPATRILSLYCHMIGEIIIQLPG